MSKPDVTFVNTLAVHGFLNGVVNLTFTTARWSPQFDAENNKVVVVSDDYESVFLRMDLHTAIVVRDALERIINQQVKPEGAVN